ncbi:hypothetical protein ELE36_18595 [Pseudolysobacter antarcticus]|uniref:Peptidase S41 n=1 Tax=Pseudolysobacter antarcticus TaxID=2511995 RepID=A0A411HNZ7_9GAMM|nr:hypothetical protein [Pseudolysobacter antarcticus]QBB72213.1 hypothetical protein ELE36_18595 [Pseudolysobacter antarcticus]
MKRGYSLAIWITAPILTLLLAGAALLVFAFVRTFYPEAPVANFPPAQDTAMAQRQDFEYFKNYFDLNRSYTPAAREHAGRLLTEYQAKAGSFSPAQFDLAIERMVALADNGHSRVSTGPLSRSRNHLPCHLYRFDDGYRVLRARPACAQLLGAKVVAIDGHAINEVADRMFEFFGGPRNHYDQFAAVFFLESPELLQAAGIASAADRVSLRVVAPDGSEYEATIVAEPPDADAPHAESNQYLSPQRIENEPADWAALLPTDAQLPIFLRDYATPFRSEYWADKGVYYVQFRSNEDEPGHLIGEFVAHVKNEIASHRPRSIVLDLRMNEGGNFTTTAALMKNLTKLADSVEHIYVLTSAWTFSAGNVSLALAKEHGGGKVTVIGEMVGDRIRMWAEGGAMTLPNSKLRLSFATGLHDYSHSCSSEPGCFWVMYFYPMHVATFDPDIHVGYSFDDYTNLRDPALERALELARIAQTAAR